MEAPGEGQVRALITLAGNPARSTPELRADRARAGRARPLRRRRHLRQRDDAPRRRDPPGAVAAAALALRPRALPARGAQRGELLAARAAARPGRAGRVGDAAAAGRASPRGSRAPDDVEPLDRLVAGELLRREAARRTRRCTGATSRSCWPRSSRAAAPSGCSTCCCARALRPHARRPRGGAARHRPRAARAAAARGAAHARAAGSSSRPRRSCATSRGCAPRSRGAPATTGCVLVGRRQLRSNNSWMHNLELLVCGPERCTLHVHPDDAARLGLADGEPARVREPRRARWRRPSRSPTP